MSNTYDALVIGGGHNGLVSAAYLARSGARTLVLEGRGSLGGAATTESPWEDAPHLRVTRLSYVMSLMPPTIVRELELERHGYKVHPMGPYYQAFPEGGSLTIYEDDPARTYEQLAKWSKKDAEAWPKWNAWLEGIADVMGPLLTQVPPNIGSHRPGDLLDLAKLAWSQRGITVRDHRRRHPAADDEHRRPAGRLVRITADQRCAGGQRRDRHLGRPVRARHRLRDGAPLDRRRRRRPARQLGIPRGRHGCGLRGDRQVGPRASVPRSAPTRASRGSLCAAAACTARSSTTATRSTRRWWSPPCTRRPRSSTRFRAPSCPTTSSPTSSTGRPAAAS